MASMLDSAKAQCKKMEGTQLFVPDREKSVANALPAALSILGQAEAGAERYKSIIPFEIKQRKFKKLFILFIDSLGISDIEMHNGLLKDIISEKGTWLSSVFPTITNVVTTSFYTGVFPEEHLLPGYRIYFDELKKTLDLLGLNVVGSRVPLEYAGIDFSKFMGCRSNFYDTPMQDNFPVYNLTPHHIMNKGMSKVLYGENVFQYGYSMLVEAFTRAKVLLENSDNAIVNLYYPNYDTIYHKLGNGSEQAKILYDYIENSLDWFLKNIDKKSADETLFLFIADHGQSNYKKGTDLTVDAGRRNKYLSYCYADEIGFSGRVRHFYTKDTDAIKQMLSDDFGDSFLAMTNDDLIASGISDAKAPDEYWRRMGDLVAVLKPGYGMYFNVEQKAPPKDPLADKMKFYAAMHGSLSAEELFVPFILQPLSALL